jgi:hypothetical protein
MGMLSVSKLLPATSSRSSPLSDFKRTVILVAALWSNSTANDLVEKKAGQVVDDIAELAKSMRLFHEFQYLNYADSSQNPIESYGEENVHRLKKASRKYDPKGVFQRQVPGGFKLGLHY